MTNRSESKQWSFVAPLNVNSITNLNQTIDDDNVEHITHSKKKKNILGYVRTKKFCYPSAFVKIIGLNTATFRKCPPESAVMSSWKSRWAFNFGKQVPLIVKQRKTREDIEKLKKAIHRGKRLDQLKLKVCSTHPIVIQRHIDAAKTSVTTEGSVRRFVGPKIRRSEFGKTVCTTMMPRDLNDDDDD